MQKNDTKSEPVIRETSARRLTLHSLALIFGMLVSMGGFVACEAVVASFNTPAWRAHLSSLFSFRSGDSAWFESKDEVAPYSVHWEFGRVSYTYGHDWHRRRVVPNNNGTEKEYAVFMGCSFIFGDGIQDDETSPYFFRFFEPQMHVYNYGLSGGGPHTALRRLENRPLTEEVQESQGIVFFNYNPSQVNRVVGRSETLAYQSHAPHYVLKEGRAEFQGSFRDASPVSVRVQEFVAKSYVLRKLLPTLERTNADYEFYCELMGELKEKVQSQLPRARFVVTNWFGQDGRPIKECLAMRGIEYWDFGTIPRDPKLMTHWDGWHPSAAENRNFAKLLAENLDAGTFRDFFGRSAAYEY